MVDSWSVPVEDLLAILGSSASGLSESEATRRAHAHGGVGLGRQQSGIALVGRQFRNPIVLLLMATAVVSMMFADIVEALITVGIVLASGCLTFAQERGAVRAVENLQRSIESRVSVLRNGRPRTLPATKVVPGDVVVLDAGAMVPADCRVLDANALMVDESTLTGESVPRHKHPGVAPKECTPAERFNCLHFGTHVSSGSATAVAVHAGSETLYGQLVNRVRHQHLPTSFERGVTRYGVLLVRATTVLVGGVFVANVVLGRQVVESMLFSLALAVGLTPQMLPAIVTVSLSAGTHLLARRRVMVTRLDAIEDFGGMTVLCTDKTGTLTSGQVSFVGGYDPEGRPDPDVETLALWNASLQRGFTNPMDEAICKTAAGNGPATDDVPDLLCEVPFDFTRKMVSVVVRSGEGALVVTKGAVDNVLECCTSVWSGAQPVRSVSDARATIEAQSRRLADQGTRHLGLAVAERPRGWSVPETADCTKPAAGIEHDLTFRGFLVFEDPIKTDSALAISQLESLGVRVVLITGDSRHAAAHIAGRVGLSVEGSVSGAELEPLDNAEWASRVARASVFSGVDPLQKERIVRGMAATGGAVGFLGDGINDVAALHAADVGISVDTAVEAAKQVADLVLLDKDLSVIADGVVEGRKVFRNTLKYVHVTTSANFGNMLSLALATLFLPFLPLLPLQVLLLNFLSDVPGMTIAADRVDPEQLRGPSYWDIGRLRKFMVVFGLISTAADLATFWLLRGVHGLESGGLRAGWFIESVLTELAALMCLRTSRPLWRSRPGSWLGWSSLGVAVVTLALVYSPVGGPLGFAGPKPSVLLGLSGIAVAYVGLTEVVKVRWPTLLNGGLPQTAGVAPR